MLWKQQRSARCCAAAVDECSIIFSTLDSCRAPLVRVAHDVAGLGLVVAKRAAKKTALWFGALLLGVAWLFVVRVELEDLLSLAAHVGRVLCGGQDLRVGVQLVHAGPLHSWFQRAQMPVKAGGHVVGELGLEELDPVLVRAFVVEARYDSSKCVDARAYCVSVFIEDVPVELRERQVGVGHLVHLRLDKVYDQTLEDLRSCATLESEPGAQVGDDLVVVADEAHRDVPDLAGRDRVAGCQALSSF